MDALRDTTKNPPPQCPNGKVGCEDENDMDIEVTFCRPCNTFDAYSDYYGDNTYNIETEFVDDSGLRPVTETRNVTYTLLPATRVSYCQGHQCAASICSVQPDGALKNGKCGKVVPTMQEACVNYTAEVLDACSAGTKWVHPALNVYYGSTGVGRVLDLRYVSWLGVSAFTPGLDPTPKASLIRAFQWMLAEGGARNMSMGASISSYCLPPFCFEFGTSTNPLTASYAVGASFPGMAGQLPALFPTVGSCSASDAGMARILATLDDVYPCFVNKVDDFTEVPSGLQAYNSSVSHSTAEGNLCSNAYDTQAVISMEGDGYGDFASVPECSPSVLDMERAFHDSCGDCSLTLCPAHPHFITPQYTAAASSYDVASKVLSNQQAILCREQGGGVDSCAALPSATTPFASAPSNELDKLFPSTSIQFNALDLTKLQVDFSIASYWGLKNNWPFLTTPTEWSLGDFASNINVNDFTMIKFPKGSLNWINDRTIYTGGFASMMQNWVTNAVLKAGLDPGLEVTTAMKPMPWQLELDIVGTEESAEQGLENLWGLVMDALVPIGCSLFIFYFLTMQVVAEKELRMRALMVMMGLDMRYYWLMEWIINSILTIVAIELFMVIGWAAEIKFVLRSPGTAFVLGFLWSQSLVTLAMLASCAFSKQLWAAITCILSMLVLALASLLMNQFAYFRSTDRWPEGLFVFSPFAFFRGINLLNRRTYALSYMTAEDEMYTVLIYLACDTIVYFVLAMYLDLILPKEFGVARHPLFPLLPLKRLICKSPPPQPAPAMDDEDDDVAAERRTVESAVKARHTTSSTEASASNPIESLSLRKVYKGGKVAVVNQTFSVHHDECFGLLGPNGAGKTTTISMLTGLYPPTSGSATVCGLDITSQMASIYKIMGVCPQFDILWPLLTIAETLMFYVRLKGLPRSEWVQTVDNSSYSVDLGHVKGRRVGRLSGGMKRRVSLAISLIGDPKVVFLDEPTTGLDPETKRSMWSLVDLAKQGRAIVLTTHSMEEADALCGRIGIMAYGKLRCLGTSLHLKDKFGEGYKIVVTYTAGSADKAAAFVRKAVPGAELLSDFNCTSTFMLPKGVQRLSSVMGTMADVDKSSGALTELSSVFDEMKAADESTGIVDWALRQTSMEEVFLRIAVASEVEKSQEFDKAAPAKKTAKATQMATHKKTQVEA
uniref:ABC transporter domain-containing protein n=1 Tax=Haptolina brevifila TaxID=156173 RepID=A0A7S2IPG3_9EUKA